MQNIFIRSFNLIILKLIIAYLDQVVFHESLCSYRESDIKNMQKKFLENISVT